jgi:eukaryotic-like serine/threonine-protein kinase
LRPASFSVSRDNLLDENLSLERYLHDITNLYNSTFPNFSILESMTDGITVAGSPVYQLVFTYASVGTNFKVIEIGTILGDKVYFMTYGAENTEFPKYLAAAQYTIDSFQIQG